MITESRIVALIIAGILIKLTKRVRILNRVSIDHYRHSVDRIVIMVIIGQFCVFQVVGDVIRLAMCAFSPVKICEIVRRGIGKCVRRSRRELMRAF